MRPANFEDLPTEIWHLIAGYLSKLQIFNLRFMNSFFLNYWLDVSWRAITINNRRPRALRLLQRIVDPFLATRTRDLTISLEHPSPSSSPHVALPMLFRTITSPSVARMLQSLSLTGHVEMFALLGEYSAHQTPFQNLAELSLDLYSRTQTEISPALEPFFRALPPTFEFLHIWTTLDPSPLLDALFQSHSPVRFPNLKSLHLCFLPDFLFSPRSLSRLLLTHSHKLQHLRLDLRMSWGKREGDLCLGAWLTDLVANSHFPSLQTLDIYPSSTQAGLSAVLTLIKCTAPTLSSLTISMRHLNFQEAEQVVDALATRPPAEEKPRKLKSLRLDLILLSVSFLDLLARKLPQLEELSLLVHEIIGSGQHSFYDLLNHRRYDPDVTCTRDVLHTWKLHDLSIRDWNDDIDIMAMRAVACAIPPLAREMGIMS